MKDEKLVQQFRDERSMEMYGKPEIQLSIAERMKLDEYIKDYNNPQWKKVMIKGKNTGYTVNNLGEVRNNNGIKCKKYQENNLWYYSVYISGFGLLLVHRLVAEAFIPNPENKPQVNHMDGIKYHNWVGNLEWVTAKENAEHAWKNNLVNNSGENQWLNIYKNKQIEEVCKLLEMNVPYSEISDKTKVDYHTISSIRNRRSWKKISSKYNIPDPVDRRLYDNKTIENVCKLLEDPRYSQQQISDITGVNINCIKDIMKKTSYKDISDNFNIKPRINSGEYNPISKYNEKQIISVCEYLSNNDMATSEISKNTGVNISVIYDILHKRKWKNVVSKYDFSKRLNKMRK